MYRRARIVVLLLLLASTSGLAQEPKENPERLERSYFLTINGARIGWAKISRVRVKEADRALIRESAEVYMSLRRSFDEAAFELRITNVDVMDTDGGPLREVGTFTNGPQVKEKVVVYSADEVVITETVAGNEPVKTTVNCNDKPLGTQYGEWKKLKEAGRLKTGQAHRFYKVDTDAHVVKEVIWTVSGPASRRDQSGRTFSGTEIIEVDHGGVTNWIVDEMGMPITATMPGGFHLEVTDSIPKDFKAELAVLESVMASDVAVEKWHRLSEVVLAIEFKHDDGEGIEPLFGTCAYHDVEKYEDGQGSGYLLRLKQGKLDKAFKAPALPLKDLPQDVAVFVKPTAMCQCDDTEIKQEAERLAKGVTNSRDLADKIMRWTAAHLKGGSGRTGSASARQAYDEKQGDCTEHAILFAAIARAAGLPSRCVSGIVYASNDGTAIFGYHAWAEVWLGQWVPVDATVNELGTSARYLLMEIDEPGHTQGSSRSARCMGQKIKPQLIEWRLEDGTSWKRKGAREFKPAQVPTKEPQEQPAGAPK